jgi:hypothetical protein
MLDVMNNNANKLPRWVPASIRPFAREAYRDNDGYWIHLFDEYEVDDSSTISGDTVADCLDNFKSGSKNAALRVVMWEAAIARKTKAGDYKSDPALLTRHQSALAQARADLAKK